MPRLVCITTCYNKGYFAENQEVTVSDARAKELLSTGYFLKSEEAPPIQNEEPPTKPRKKITVK